MNKLNTFKDKDGRVWLDVTSEKHDFIIMLKQIYALTVQYEWSPELLDLIQADIQADIDQLERELNGKS